MPTGGYYFSKSFWQDRTAEERGVLLDSLSRATAKSMVDWTGLIDEAFETARQENIALIEPTAEDAATLESFSGTFVSTLPEAEIARRGIEDPTPLIDDMVLLVDKWKSLLAEVDRSNVDEVTALLEREIFDRIDIETYGMD